MNIQRAPTSCIFYKQLLYLSTLRLFPMSSLFCSPRCPLFVLIICIFYFAASILTIF